jgi:hydroxymethylbilane synthase
MRDQPNQSKHGSARRVVIGSRGSDLALYQANLIRGLLEQSGEWQAEIEIIKTAGDQNIQVSFDKMEGKGFFTKEIEEALLDKRIDLAVHSLKDLMTTQPPRLTLGAVGFRANPREMLLMRPEARQASGTLPIKEGSTIGTSSNRRRCQIAALNPSLAITDLRGNVPTRVAKLRDGKYDAIVIAAAGVERLALDLSGLETMILPRGRFLPAPGQGILGLQIRSADVAMMDLLAPLNSKQNSVEVALERGLLARFESGCSLPLGVTSDVMSGELRLRAVLGVKQGDRWSGLVSCDVQGTDAEKVVNEAYDILTEAAAQ